MEFKTFVEKVIEELKNKLGENYTITSNQVLKNNSVVFGGVLIKEGDQNIVPSIYLDSFYPKYLSHHNISQIADEVIAIYDETKKRPFKFDKLEIDRDYILCHAFFRLVNYEKNEQLLADSVYERINDLAVVVYFCVENGTSQVSSTRLTKELCKKYEIGEEEAINEADKKTEEMFPAVFKPITDFIDVGCFEPEDVPVSMYVLSNSKSLYGAATLTYNGLLDSIYEKLGGDFYILPSSVHETIIVPASVSMDNDKLCEMVRTINRDEVAEEDVLSDRVYHYPFDRFEI